VEGVEEAPQEKKPEPPKIVVGALLAHTKIDDCNIRPELGFIPRKGLPTNLIKRMEEIRERKKTWSDDPAPLNPRQEALLAQIDLECTTLNAEFFAQREECGKKSEETLKLIHEQVKALADQIPKPPVSEGEEEPDPEAEAEAEPEPEFEQELDENGEPVFTEEGEPKMVKRKPPELSDEEKELFGKQFAETERVLGELMPLINARLRADMDDWTDKQKIFVDVLKEAVLAFLGVLYPGLTEEEGTFPSKDVPALLAKMPLLSFFDVVLRFEHIPEYARNISPEEFPQFPPTISFSDFWGAFLNRYFGPFLLDFDSVAFRTRLDDALAEQIEPLTALIAKAKEALAYLQFKKIVKYVQELESVCADCHISPLMPPPEPEPAPTPAEGEADPDAEAPADDS